MSPKGRLVGSIAQLAAVFGVSQRSVRTLISEGLPVARRGHGSRPALFDIADACAWLRRKQKAASAASDGLERLRAARADREERRNRLEARELVSVADITEHLTRYGHSIAVHAGTLVQTDERFREIWTGLLDAAERDASAAVEAIKRTA